jgi:hypothetical protein
MRPRFDHGGGIYWQLFGAAQRALDALDLKPAGGELAGGLAGALAVIGVLMLMRTTTLLFAAAAIGLCAAGCGSNGSTSSTTAASKTVTAASSGSVEISSRSVPGVGVMLVDGHDRTLYI